MCRRDDILEMIQRQRNYTVRELADYINSEIKNFKNKRAGDMNK